MAQFRLRAADGYELGAELHAAARPSRTRRVVVLHCGAGIAAARYRHFARFLAEWGIPVLTYDYRGIGASRPAQLQGFEVTTSDWVEYDAAGAIAWVREHFPNDNLVGISHSIGALALAAAPNAAEQDCLIFVSPHTAYYGDYRPLYRLPMALFWHGVMPIVTRRVGYFPARRLRLGDDIPAGIALEWARRRSPDLRTGSAPAQSQRVRTLLDRAGALDRPALALTVSDDAFATPQAADRLLSYFPSLRSEKRLLTPAEAKVARLGHFGFFRPEAGAFLWPLLLSLLGSLR